MTDFEDMKSKWQALSNAKPSDTDNTWKGLDAHKKSQLYKVRRTFILLAILSAVCCIVVPANMLRLGMPLWIALVTCVYFAVCMFANIWMKFASEDIDIASSSAAGVMAGVERIMRRRMQVKWVLLPVALLIIGMILYYVSYDKYAVLGGVAGGLIGFSIGYRIDQRIKRQLRSIARDLESA